MADDQMADDHRRDNASSIAMDTLRTQIHAFLKDQGKTHRLRPATRVALEEVCIFLKADSDHVTAIWD